MNRDDEEDKTIYKVVVNHEGHIRCCSPTRRTRSAGRSRTECFAYIKELWTDMRPLSLRKKMEASLGKA